MSCPSEIAQTDVACPCCARLTAELAKREGEYALACALLAVAGKTGNRVQHLELTAECKDALVDYNFARTELEKHRTIHTA